MKYCSECSAKVEVKIPEGDNRERFVCTDCGIIHYQNPKIIAGCLPVKGEQVLLCKRAIEPRYGLWTLPAGFMENAETTEEGAARETREEANAEVKVGNLFTVYSLPHINQVYMMYMGELLNNDFGPGSESLEVALFNEEDIPWDQLAFKTIEGTLKHFFADRRAGHFELHSGQLNSRHGRPVTK